VQIEAFPEEDFFLISSRLDGVSIEQIAQEFQLETMRDYFARSTKQREQMLRTHGKDRG
jgi:hypothetical protein